MRESLIRRHICLAGKAGGVVQAKTLRLAGELLFKEIYLHLIGLDVKARLLDHATTLSWAPAYAKNRVPCIRLVSISAGTYETLVSYGSESYTA